MPAEERDEYDEPELVEFTFGSDIVNQPKNDGALKGAFTRTTIGEGVLAIGATTFPRTDSSNATVDTNRSYIAGDEAFPRGYKVEIIFDETGEDGIAATLQKVAKGGDIFTVDGRLVKRGNLNSLNGMKKGIYIINGIKTIVK